MSMRSLKVSLILIALVLVTGCDTTGLENEFFKDAEEISFEEVERGSYGDVANQNLVIRQESQFNEFWESLHQSKTPIPELPEVDFNNQMVIAATMETQPSGGFSIEITQVRLKSGILGVQILSTKPGDGCITTAALTTPYHLIKVDKRSEEVEFLEEEKINDCSE